VFLFLKGLIPTPQYPVGYQNTWLFSFSSFHAFVSLFLELLCNAHNVLLQTLHILILTDHWFFQLVERTHDGYFNNSQVEP